MVPQCHLLQLRWTPQVGLICFCFVLFNKMVITVMLPKPGFHLSRLTIFEIICSFNVLLLVFRRNHYIKWSGIKVQLSNLQRSNKHCANLQKCCKFCVIYWELLAECDVPFLLQRRQLPTWNQLTKWATSMRLQSHWEWHVNHSVTMSTPSTPHPGALARTGSSSYSSASAPGQLHEIAALIEVWSMYLFSVCVACTAKWCIEKIKRAYSWLNLNK